MENKATLIAIGGVVVIGLGVLAQSVITGQAMDPELIKLIVTGLVGFASGAAAVKIAG